MTDTNPLSTFHRWLLAAASDHPPVRTIMLHGAPSVFSDRLIEEIADYLNEYDDDDAGCWLGATTVLVNQVSASEHLRRLLGIEQACPNCPPASACGIRKTLSALGGRGHVILRDLTPSDIRLDLPHAFHAGIGNPSDKTGECHLVLNPDLMDPASLAHIIGDVFLEWLQDQLRTRPCSSVPSCP